MNVKTPVVMINTREHVEAGSGHKRGVLGRVLLLGFATTLGACHRGPPLTLELAAIRCPADRSEHARVMFGNAELTFVCISKARADNPAMLRCDPTSRPLICEDAGSFLFTRSEDGAAYSGLAPDPAKPSEAPTLETPHRSRLLVNFRNEQPGRPTFDAVETPRSFLLVEGKELLPPQFTFVKGTLCDRETSVLNFGTCNLEARSASLYWHVAVSIPGKTGTPISPEQYRDELAFWLKRLGQMVVDPKK
jgi:hypothetical protein